MWVVVGDSILARYFELENIWQKEWIATEQVAIINGYWHDGDDRDLVLRIWATDIHGRPKSFAVSEAGGMGRWVFAVPANEVELLVHSSNATSKP
jgi:hypothetical protein